MAAPPRPPTAFALITLCSLLIVACAPRKPVVNRIGPAASASPGRGSNSARGANHGARVPISELIARAEADLRTMTKIWSYDYSTGRALGRLNGAFQRAAFFSWIPTIAATDSLKAELGRLAALHNLILEDLRAPVPPKKAPPAEHLRAGERWKPTDADLFATIALEIDLQGSRRAAARFVDAVPDHLERLVVITGERPRAGGVRLVGRCYMERGTPMPEFELPWPELEQRLRAAGYDPEDPQLANAPEVARLSALVNTGRRRMLDVRNTLAVTSDFPRWFARARFLKARMAQARAVRGAELLGTVGG